MDPTTSGERTEAYWTAIKWAYLALAKGRIEYAPSVHSYVPVRASDEFAQAMGTLLTAHAYANTRRTMQRQSRVDDACSDRAFFYQMYAEILDAWGTYRGCFYVDMPMQSAYLHYPGPGLPPERYTGSPPHDGLPVVVIDREETYPWNWQVNPHER